MVRQLSFSIVLLAAAALASASLDMADELAGQWRMGLRPRQASANLQAFRGALAGESAPGITNSGDPERPFEVDGDTFTDFESAVNRACDNQKNACAEQANNGGADIEVSDCDSQSDECKDAGRSATETSFDAVVSSDADFDFICDP
ncbi:hypothetical protein CC79DRAFT_484605 [Sarocladium strictum]